MKKSRKALRFSCFAFLFWFSIRCTIISSFRVALIFVFHFACVGPFKKKQNKKKQPDFSLWVHSSRWFSFLFFNFESFVFSFSFVFPFKKKYKYIYDYCLALCPSSLQEKIRKKLPQKKILISSSLAPRNSKTRKNNNNKKKRPGPSFSRTAKGHRGRLLIGCRSAVDQSGAAFCRRRPEKRSTWQHSKWNVSANSALVLWFANGFVPFF